MNTCSMATLQVSEQDKNGQETYQTLSDLHADQQTNLCSKTWQLLKGGCVLPVRQPCKGENHSECCALLLVEKLETSIE